MSLLPKSYINPLFLWMLLSVILAITLPLSCIASSKSHQTTNNKTWYQIEMIYFTQIPQGEQQHESWPYISPFALPSSPVITLTPRQTDAIPTIINNQTNNPQLPIATPTTYPFVSSQNITTPTPLQNHNYILLPSTYFKLSKIETALHADNNYHVISHISWLERVPTKANDAPILYVHADNNGMTINSLIRLYRQRYFEVHFNTKFDLPLTNIPNASAEIEKIAKDASVRFLLTQNRRMRSKELNYIDFPYFGALIEIYPIKDKQLLAITNNIKTANATNPDLIAPAASTS